jgi:hypothetical protein
MYALQLCMKPLRLDWQIAKPIKTRVERSLQLVSRLPVAARTESSDDSMGNGRKERRMNLTIPFHSNPIYVSENSFFRNTYPDQLGGFPDMLKHMAVTKGS